MISEERLRELWKQFDEAECFPVIPFARAVEREAYEAAARVVEERRGPIEIYNKSYPAMMDCAAAIRALKEKP